MKQSTRICSLLLVLLMLLPALASCRTEPDSNPDATTETSTAPTFFAVDLSQYKIIRGEKASDSDISTAADLKSKLSKALDMMIEIGTDFVSTSYTDRVEYEIIVGHTDIAEEIALRQTLDEGEYIVDVSEKKIIITGYSTKEVAYAADRFLSLAVGYSDSMGEIPTLSSPIVELTSERGVRPAPDGAYREPTTEPLDPSKVFKSGNFTVNGNGILFTSTGSASFKNDTGKGSYFIQFTVESTKGEHVQLFTNMRSGSNSQHLLLQIIGNNASIERATYRRNTEGHFSGDPKNYTVRLEVHPEAQLARYYINGNFIGEMNVGDSETPLIEKCSFSVNGLGNDIHMTIKDFYLENIEAVDARRYDAPNVSFDNENIYPKAENAPAKTIYVIKPSGLSNEDRMTAVTLQGLVNRTTPELFYDFRDYNMDPTFMNIAAEEEYLDMLKDKGRTVRTITLEKALEKYKDRYAGIIKGNCFQHNYSENFTTSLCGVLDSVYMSTALYTRVKSKIDKEVTYDLKKAKFKTSIEAYRYLWENYEDQFSKQIIFHVPTVADSAGYPSIPCRDYAVMAKAMCFFTTDMQTLDDYDFYLSLFMSTAPNTGIMGRGGGAFGEFEMFKICGQMGKYFTYGYSMPNMSLLSTLEIGELKQKEPAEQVKLEKDTIYVTYDISEGDNLSWDYHLWMYNFTDKADRERIPKGYSICGALYYVAPSVLELLYSKATPNDYFFLDGGGISNLASPDDFGLLYKDKDREQIMKRMLELTNYVAEKTDISVLRAIDNISDDMAKRFDKECPQIEMLLSSYGNNTEEIGGTSNYQKATYMVDDIVRCKSYLTTFSSDLAGQAKELVSRAGNTKDGIIFAKTFVYCNPILSDVGVLDQYKAAIEATGKKVVVLRPDEYARLYREYVGA